MTTSERYIKLWVMNTREMCLVYVHALNNCCHKWFCVSVFFTDITHIVWLVGFVQFMLILEATSHREQKEWRLLCKGAKLVRSLSWHLLTLSYAHEKTTQRKSLCYLMNTLYSLTTWNAAVYLPLYVRMCANIWIFKNLISKVESMFSSAITVFFILAMFLLYYTTIMRTNLL